MTGWLMGAMVAAVAGGGYPCKDGGKGESPLGCQHFAAPGACGIQLCDQEL